MSGCFHGEIISSDMEEFVQNSKKLSGLPAPKPGPVNCKIKIIKKHTRTKPLVLRK